MLSVFDFAYSVSKTTSASMLRSAAEISRGKTRYLHCIDAGFMTVGNPLGIMRTLLPQMEDFAVTCPLVPSAPHLISGFCSSPKGTSFGRRPAVSDWASFRPRLATTPLPFSLPSALRRGVRRTAGAAKPGQRTYTDEVTRHAPAHVQVLGRCAALYRAASPGTYCSATFATRRAVPYGQDPLQ
jgi:hypothetical protein